MAHIIRVNWEAFAASDEKTRKLCGTRGFLMRAAENDGYTTVRPWLCGPAERQPFTITQPFPDMLEWLKERNLA